MSRSTDDLVFSDTGRHLQKILESLESDSEKFSLVYRFLFDKNRLPNFILSEENLKSAKKCADLRKQGDAFQKEKMLIMALLLYTESIANSPFPASSHLRIEMEGYLSAIEISSATEIGSCDLAFAFADRAFVLYEIGKYDLCMKDIQRAEECGYPSYLVYKLHGRKVKCSLKLGVKTDALKLCEEAQASLSLATSLCDREVEECKSELLALVDEINKLDGCVQEAARKKDDTDLENIQVSHGQNKRMPSASNAIDLKHYKEIGLGIVATRDIRVGDVLLVEKPFAGAFSAKGDDRYLYCAHCFRYCLALIPCYRCSVVMFCSEQCRKELWKSCHHIDCYISSVTELDLKLMPSEHLAMNVVATASSKHNSLPDFYAWFKSVCEHTVERGFDENGQYVSNDYRTIYHLKTNKANACKFIVLMYAIRAAFSFHFIDSKTKYFSQLKPAEEMEIKMFIGGLIFRYITTISCSQFTVQEHVDCIKPRKTIKKTIRHEVGSAAYAVANLFNHSCNPNVMYITYGDKMIHIASQPIKEGEQVFKDHHAMFYNLPHDERRKLYSSSKYPFRCRCDPCQGNWPVIKELPTLSSSSASTAAPACY